jgi:hypothetical protein
VSRSALLRQERRLLALVASLDGEYLDAVLLKVAFLRRIYLSMPLGTVITMSDVVDILEDEDLGLSDEAAIEILERSGLIAAGEGGWSLREEVLPVHPLVAEAEQGGLTLTREEIVGLLADGGGEKVNAAIDELLRCLDRTSRWGVVIAGSVPEQLAGVPCFWEYPDGVYTVFNLDPASVTTSDALRLIVERVRASVRPLTLSDEERLSVYRLWQMLLDLERTDTDWNHGSFSVDGEDDDFVGAFDPERPDLGPCPTVDATGGAVVALCAALRAELVDGASRAMALEERTHHAIRDGVAFILRCQQTTGGWPLYRYESDAFPMFERDVSSWYAVDALSEAVRSGLLDDATATAARAAALAFLKLAERSVHREGDTASWTPDFFTPLASDSGTIQATASVALALGAVGSAWPELSERTEPLRRSAARGIARKWTPDSEALAVVNFRVPTWDGPAPTKFPWEWPLDALVVQVLSDVDEPWSEELSARLTIAVAGFLATEVNGHWNDVLMKRETGADRAVVGSTIFFHTALLAYVARQAEIVRRSFAPPTHASWDLGGAE